MEEILVGNIIAPTFNNGELSHFVILSIDNENVKTKWFTNKGTSFEDKIEKTNLINALEIGEYSKVDKEYLLDLLIDNLEGFELGGVEITEEDTTQTMELIKKGQPIEDSVFEILHGIYDTLHEADGYDDNDDCDFDY